MPTVELEMFQRQECARHCLTWHMKWYREVYLGDGYVTDVVLVFMVTALKTRCTHMLTIVMSQQNHNGSEF